MSFEYFKCFNQVNKLSKEINNDLNYINYEDSILDYIYDNFDIELAKIFFPLVEDKKLLNKFIERRFSSIEWIYIIYKNGFNEHSEIDISLFEGDLISELILCGNINLIEKLIEKYKKIEGFHFQEMINSGFNFACMYDECLEILKLLIKNGADIRNGNCRGFKIAKFLGQSKIINYLKELDSTFE